MSSGQKAVYEDQENYLRLCTKYGETPQGDHFGCNPYSKHAEELEQREKDDLPEPHEFEAAGRRVVFATDYDAVKRELSKTRQELKQVKTDLACVRLVIEVALNLGKLQDSHLAALKQSLLLVVKKNS